MIDIDEGFYKNQALSTAGAISVRNAKGQLVTKRVRVQRHVAGKEPDYVRDLHDDVDDDDDEKTFQNTKKTAVVARNEQEDGRLRRLQARDIRADEIDEHERIVRRRRVIDPEILQASSSSGDEQDDDEEEKDQMDIEEPEVGRQVNMDLASSDDDADDDDEEMDEEAIERRRQRVRMKARQKEEELLQIEDEKEAEQEESESSEESESDDDDEEEDDEGVPRWKPLFVPKNDRQTVAEREAEEKRQLQLEIEKKRLADQRKIQSHELVAAVIREERIKEKEADDGIQCDFDTDDEDAEAAYDAWKLRELKRLKRDRDERDQREREKQELERWHNMTEEEREAEMKRNPKIIDNQAPKGKYKYLQKYYHRGAFFMDKDDEIYRRDYTAATLEDRFDKSILPKVMQVKNFGMAGRTKYTHLVDQDTTERDKSKRLGDKQALAKFHREHGGGMKSVFERPKLKKTSKKDD